MVNWMEFKCLVKGENSILKGTLKVLFSVLINDTQQTQLDSVMIYLPFLKCFFLQQSTKVQRNE